MNSILIEIIQRKQVGGTAHTSFSITLQDVCISINTVQELITFRAMITDALNEAIPDDMQNKADYLTAKWFQAERKRLKYLEEYEMIPILNRLEKLVKSAK